MKTGEKFKSFSPFLFTIIDVNMDALKLKEKFNKVKVDITPFKEVDFHGMKIKLSPLDGDQEISLVEATKNFDNLAYLLNVKKETLARAIVAIDEESLGETIKDGEVEVDKVLWLKKNFISRYAQAEIDALFNAYLVLQLEMDEKVKNGIKFTNSDLINKFLEEEAVKKSVETIKKVVEDTAPPAKE